MKQDLRSPNRTTTLLRASILAVAAVLLAWRLTVPAGLVAAFLGAFLGASAGDAATRLRLRPSSGLGLAIFILLLGAGLTQLLVRFGAVAAVLGPLRTLALSEATRWLLLTAPVVFLLRLLAHRHPLGGLPEVLMVAFAFVSTLAAHRDGMVHRPHLIGDWAWQRGLDPALVLLLLGGLGTLLLAGLMVREERKKRLPLHFSVLAATAIALLLIVRVSGLPAPESAGDLGLTGDPNEEQEQAGGEGGQGQREGEGDASPDPNNSLDDLEFKDEYGSSGEQAPVAVAVLHDDYSPPSGVYYFRQSVFSQYNGHRLVRATRDDVDRDLVARFPTEELRVAETPPSGDRRPLRTSIGLMVDHVNPFALDSPVLFRPTRNPNPMRIKRTFDVISNVPVLPYPDMIGRRPGKWIWNEQQWDHYTEAPNDPRYARTADELVAALRDEYRRDPLAQALAIKDYLDVNGIYSLRSKHAGAEDPTASFLFGNLTGYCVHFAHAATYLFRSRGIPARVAAGYAVSEASRGEGSTLMIRGGDAHAWPEIYLQDVGWVVVDLAPQQTLDPPNGPPDPTLQNMLGEMLREQMGDEMDWKDQIHEPFDWAALLQRMFWALAAVLLLAYGVKAWRALAPRFAPASHLPRLGYRASLDRLAEVGLRRGYGESRERFAVRASSLAPAFAGLTDVHLRHALGSSRGGGDVDRLQRQMSQEIRGRIPAWRRVLGRLHPFSWLGVR